MHTPAAACKKLLDELAQDTDQISRQPYMIFCSAFS